MKFITYKVVELENKKVGFELVVRGEKQVLTPEQVMAVDPSFIEATGLQGSLTPSRANGFLNILLNMKAQAQQLARVSSSTTS